MPRSAVYFNWDTKEKYCNGFCKSVRPLASFRPASAYVCGPEKASHYRYICMSCENVKAKAYQAKRYVRKT